MLAVSRGWKSQGMESSQSFWREHCPASNVSSANDNFKPSSLKIICYSSHRKSIQVLLSIWLWACSIPVCCSCSSVSDISIINCTPVGPTCVPPGSSLWLAQHIQKQKLLVSIICQTIFKALGTQYWIKLPLFQARGESCRKEGEESRKEVGYNKIDKQN